MNRDVMVVLLNYARPHHMPAVIQAWRQQTVPLGHLVVVDNSPPNKHLAYSEPYPQPDLRGADDVWRMTTNHGCPSRFAPALAIPGFRYVLFADDDMLPGKRAIENLLLQAEKLHDCFATIGQSSRNFNLEAPAGKRYAYRDVRRTADLQKVHLTVRSHFVVADSLTAAVDFRNSLIHSYGQKALDLCRTHDDMLLCLGLQEGSRDYGRSPMPPDPCYILPLSADPECELIKENLPGSNEGVHKRPGHLAERNAFVDMALEFGWRPVT